MLSEGVDLTPSKELSPELYKAWTFDNIGKEKLCVQFKLNIECAYEKRFFI